MRRIPFWLALPVVLLASLAFQATPPPPHVVMISIDGLMPSTYLKAGPDDVPTLRAMKEEGAFAEGVVGILPTVTYASHTTLITGVPPAVHGIYGNEIFDPEHKSNDAWYWYAREIRVPTLVDAARTRGMTTAAVSWSVTVGLQADFLQPEFWRTGSGHPTDRWLMRALSTPGLLDDLERAKGAPLPWPLTDRTRAELAAYIIRTHRPRILILHLLGLDGAQHADGPGSPRAQRVVGEMDSHVKLVRDAVAAAGLADRTYMAIVSDHGFRPIERQLQPNALFRQEGLLSVDDRGTITDWQVYFHSGGGSGFVYLKDPSNAALRDRVRGLLEKLRDDPQYGIASLWSREDLDAFGADPNAVFGIGMRSGFYTGFGHTTLTTTTRNRGGHGFDPRVPDLHASLILTGGAFRGRGSLGVVRMTQIAPTLAGLLGLELSPQADRPLPFGASGGTVGER